MVVKKYSGFYYVQSAGDGIYECRLRGKLKDEVLSGDKVVYTRISAQRGAIERIMPRLNQLDRPRVANVSLALIIMAQTEPMPSLMLLDRLLVLCLYHKIRPLIILNKSDLEVDEASRAINEHYPPAGFTVIRVSAETGEGISEMRQAIAGEIAVLAGPSGVGKSSLLNAVFDNQEARTQELSQRLGRGKHTTRHVELYPLLGGGWLVDTPGFSMLEMPPIKRADLAGFYPEFDGYAEECRFRNCLHHKDIDCAVREALKEGKIAKSRYEHYLYMLEEIMENERKYP